MLLPLKSFPFITAVTGHLIQAELCHVIIKLPLQDDKYDLITVIN